MFVRRRFLLAGSIARAGCAERTGPAEGHVLSSSDSQPQSSVPAPGRRSESTGAADPYRDWLGLATLERPPSPYALLGLPELESNPRAVSEAARRTKKTMRAYQIGKYREQALALLGEIGQAVETLSNRENKAAYDEQRLQQLLEVAQARFPQKELERPLDEIFGEWLDGLRKSGMPLPQMIPALMAWCLSRAFSWPPHGPLKVPLPLGLWVYFEAAVVGRCVERSPLEQRALAVKRVQQSLGIGEQLSRMVILDTARRPESFAGSEVVRVAASAPRDLMQRWLDRLAGRAAVLETDSPAYASLAFLLGLADWEGRPIAEPVRPRILTAEKVTLADRLGDVWARVAGAFRDRAVESPQFIAALKIAALISVVLLLLLLLLLAIART